MWRGKTTQFSELTFLDHKSGLMLTFIENIVILITFYLHANQDWKKDRTVFINIYKNVYERSVFSLSPIATSFCTSCSLSFISSVEYSAFYAKKY